MITYGILTSTSIGRLFLAGVIPGALILLGFCAAVVVITRVDKNAAPGGQKASWKERFVSLKKVWLMLLLIVVVLGSIWGGLCTPTEASAIGSFGTFLIAVSRKNMTFKDFRAALSSTMKVTAMIFFLLIGASVFSNFITVTKAPTIIAKWVASSNIAPTLIIAIMCLIYIFLGCLMDTLSMILLTLPIFTPIVTALGYDLVWFGILVTLMCMMGSITPPVGINCFVVGGMVENVTTGEVFKGVIPFILALIAVAAILIAFPSVVTWLPNLIMG
jgi:tripartite ATP-independent transporter DctM subunit